MEPRVCERGRRCGRGGGEGSAPCPASGPALRTCSFSLSPKPSEGPELDEDEGFGDWSQKPEQRRQHCGAGETADGGAPPRGESPDGGQEEDRQVGVRAWRRGALSKPPNLCPSDSLRSRHPSGPPKCPRGRRGGRRKRTRQEGGGGGAGAAGGTGGISLLGSPGPRPVQTSCGRRAVTPSAHLQPTDVREALRPRRRPFLPRGSELHSHGGEQVFPDVRPPVGLGGQAFQMCRRSEPGQAGGGALGWGLLWSLTHPHPGGLSRSQHPTGRGQGPSSARELQARGPVASRVAGAPLGHLPSPPRSLKQPRALSKTPPVTPPPLPIHAQSQLPGQGPAPGVALYPRPPSRPQFPPSVSAFLSWGRGAGAAGWPVHWRWDGCSPAGPVSFVPNWPSNSRGHYSSSVDPPALARPPCPPHLPGLL